MTRSARPARMDKPLRCRPLEGRRDQRSPLRRCFKPRPPLSAGCAGFASGCRSSGSELRRPMTRASLGIESRRSLRAAVRPLVRMPTNRHAATGTCEIGRTRNRHNCREMQAILSITIIFFCTRGRHSTGEGDERSPREEAYPQRRARRTVVMSSHQHSEDLSGLRFHRAADGVESG